MSQVIKVQCDYCRTQTTDPYSEKGWITLGGTDKYMSITINLGRDKKNTADAIFIRDRSLDFCNIECLTAFFRAKIADRSEE